MVRKLIVEDYCDGCDHLDLPAPFAAVEHTLTVDGGPLRRVQLCPRCAIVWEPLILVYKERGQDVETAPKETPAKRAAKKPRAKAVKAAKSKELEPPAPLAQEQTVAEADEQAPAGKPKKPRQYLMCPLTHKSGDGPRRVVYGDRNSHADVLHDHARIWEIRWQDPDGILPRDDEGNPLHACDAHAECMETGLAFTSAVGLKQHENGCPLPRIDQEGDPQKADEPTP